MRYLILFLILAGTARADDLQARLEALQAAEKPAPVTVVPGLDQPPAYVPSRLGDTTAADLERRRMNDAEDAREEARQAAEEAAAGHQGDLKIGPGSELSRFDSYGIRPRHRR